MSAIARYDYNELVKRVQDYCVQREIPVPRWRREVNREEELAFHANVLRAMKDLGSQLRDAMITAQQVTTPHDAMGAMPSAHVLR